MEIKSALPYRQEIIALLKSEKLPAEDLSAELDGFLAILDNGHIIAAGGIEQYGEYALLRSVVVSPGFRKKGAAALLLAAIEEQAFAKEIKALYLLTETAQGYFDQKGYAQIQRDGIPEEVQQSSEFSYVCPQSAIAMKKIIGSNQ